MIAEAPLRHVLSRLNWRPTEGGGLYRSFGEVRIALFDSIDDAWKARWEKERIVRRRVNPFRCGDELSRLTSLPEYAFSDFLADAGLEPPTPHRSLTLREWRIWWNQTRPQMAEEQRDRVWEALDRVRFFSVRAERSGTSSFVVTRIVWEMVGGRMEPARGGGEPVRTYLRWEDAESYRAMMEEQERRWHIDNACDSSPLFNLARLRETMFPSSIESDSDYEAERLELVPGREARFYDIVEIPQSTGSSIVTR